MKYGGMGIIMFIMNLSQENLIQRISGRELDIRLSGSMAGMRFLKGPILKDRKNTKAALLLLTPTMAAAS